MVNPNKKGANGMNKTKQFYEEEQARIEQKIAELDVGTPEYKAAWDLMRDTNKSFAEHREARRRISKEAKGNFLIKALGIIGIGATAYGMAKFEKDGGMFTGEKRKWADSIVNILSKFNLFG
jgi:hypothetical protein